jgi:hypothetical protein
MSSRLAGRLSAARQSRIVGRASEQALFQLALAEAELPLHVLHVFGPSGVGKSTLLRLFAHHCEQRNIPAIQIDARNVEPAPEAFVNALRPAMNLGPQDSPFEAMAAHPGHVVILIDTYEALAPLDDWVRETLLGELPENMLMEVFKVTDAHELFEWLRDLSFIEPGQQGLFPHDLAREALAADVRWRNPDWYSELHHRARRYYTARLQQTHGAEQQRILFDLIFLHRDNAVVRPFYDWQGSGGTVVADILRPGDETLLTAWDYLQCHAPLRPGEGATYFRYWMTSDTRQAVSPIQSLIFVNIVRHYLTTPGLAYTMLPCSEPDFWVPVFDYAELTRLPEADFEISGRRYGVYGHDWRVMPPMAWLALMGEKEIAVASQATPVVQPTMPLFILSEPEFAEAVRDALRDYARASAFRNNPLLRSRLVANRNEQKMSSFWSGK